MQERKLVPKTKFNSFFYWNLDSKPTDNDDISKALQWLEMANMVSQRLIFLHSYYFGHI